MRSSGAGGQHVNTTDSAVRINPLAVGHCRHQFGKVSACEPRQGDATAEDPAVVRKKSRNATLERAEARASQVGSGDRSEKIRTYNYPENRVTDHRIGLTLYALDKIIAGDKLEDVVDALMTEDQARRLAAMEDA